MSNPDPLTPSLVSHVDDTATPVQVRRAIWATRLQFAALGMFGGAWGVHIPSVKTQYELGEMALSLVLVSGALGAVVSLFFAGRVIGRLGARNAAAGAALVMGLLLAAVLHWPSVFLLLLSNLLFGACMSLFDVAINTEGSALEALGQRAIMGNLHGNFSLGGMLGAALTGALIRMDISAPWQLAWIGVGFVLWVNLGSRWMLAVHPENNASEPTAHFVWPKGVLLIIGLLAFAGMTAEGAMYDWCVLYLKQEVHMTQDHAALGYAAFSGAMAVMRFAGDTLRMRFAERSILRVGGLTTASAMAVVLVSGVPWIAIVGYAFVGAGLAQVVPILYNAATRVPGSSRAAAIASVSSIGYAGFMVGPPLIGGIAQAASLTAALTFVVLGSALLAWGARYVPER
jgi:predicted MFS family arabinose efflux permease